LDLVNAETGTSVWPTPIRDVRTDLPFIVDGDAIFVTREREFVAFNFLDASPMTIAEFEFEGGEQPLLVQMVGTNFLISANQNILSLGRAGNVEYQRYYEPPGRSWLENAAILLSEAFVAATVYKCLDLGAVGAAGAASLMSQRDFRARAFEACTSATVENPDSVLPPSAEDAVNWANYTYVYTKQPSSAGRDGFSLVKLDVRNGKEVARVWIDERRPNYVLDPISGFVFVKENDNEIFALKFPDN
jgi:hypothetical protein